MNFKATKLKAPFGWIGGKAKLAKQIIEMMPEHKLYVEVFGGSLSVLYAKPFTYKIVEVVNDINSELVNLHRIIRTRPQTLALVLRDMLVAREIFNDIRDGKLKPNNDIERAAFYYYLIINSFSCNLDSFKTAKIRQPNKLYKDFTTWSERLRRVSIENKSFDELILGWDKQYTLFYLDPPYIGSEFYYTNTLGFGLKEHELLAEILRNIKGKFILSYNDTPKVRELYAGFNFKELSTTYTLNRNSAKESGELLIYNF